MIDSKDLIDGEWYWAVPLYDVDDDRSYQDQAKPVPSQYLGQGKWIWPDAEGDHWPCNGLVYAHITRPEVKD